MRKALLFVGLVGVVALIAAPGAAAAAPTVATTAATSVTTNSATLNGTVNPAGQQTSYAFQWGTTTQYGHETTLTLVGSGTSTTSVSAALSGLNSGTAYHFRIIAISPGGIATGADQTFTTPGTPPAYLPAAPKVTTGLATNVNTSGATVQGTVNPMGTATTYYFEYGTTIVYGFQTAPVGAGAGTADVAAAAGIGGVANNTTIHYRLVAVNPGGTSIGSDQSFNTAAATSRLALFGHTAFVSPESVVGVFTACLGGTKCVGSMTLSRHGVVLGKRAQFFVGAQDGGFVHFGLNSLGARLVRQRHRLSVHVVVVDSAGRSSSGDVTLVQFS
jgi:hypothetical protein